MGVDSIGSPILWIGFTIFVLAMLGLDLGVTADADGTKDRVRASS